MKKRTIGKGNVLFCVCFFLLLVLVFSALQSLQERAVAHGCITSTDGKWEWAKILQKTTSSKMYGFSGKLPVGKKKIF